MNLFFTLFSIKIKGGFKELYQEHDSAQIVITRNGIPSIQKQELGSITNFDFGATNT